MNSPSNRKYVLIGAFGFVAVVFIARLFYLQVIDDSAKRSAKQQAFRHVTVFPSRGYIYDRNHKLLVSNEAAYDLMVLPREMDKKNFDTLNFCHLLKIDTAEFTDRMISATRGRNSPYKESLFEKQLSAETYARLQELLYKYKGFRVQTRTLRKYPQSTAAHILGYVGEVDSKIVDTNKYYHDGDFIGISGIEKTYETVLRGKKGTKIILRDVNQQDQGSYMSGLQDTASVPGLSLTSSLDIVMQQYGELLMQNKKGSIVAIEPATGEILTLVTSPAYDPNLLVGNARTKNYLALAKDTVTFPLFNRATMASYPPGSTFKLIMALIAQKENVLSQSTAYPCSKGYPLLGGRPGCHPHSSPLALQPAIGHSCNSYFSFVLKSMIENKKYSSIYAAYDSWRSYVMSFCMGQRTGSDLANELKGNVPSKKYYDKLFGKDAWKTSNIISLGIGQAELLVTPLQNANLVAIIANKGWYYIPHIIKAINHNSNDPSLARFKEKKYSLVSDTSLYNIVINGMSDAVETGTAHSLKINGIEYCAKTGTAENPHGKSHSVFIAFAPRVDPKIAIAVLVENAGAGSHVAGPIAALMMEKYLVGKTSKPELENRIINEKLIGIH